MTIKRIEEIKKLLNMDIKDDLLLRILFEMNRFFDKKITAAVQCHRPAALFLPSPGMGR